MKLKKTDMIFEEIMNMLNIFYTHKKLHDQTTKIHYRKLSDGSVEIYYK